MFERRWRVAVPQPLDPAAMQTAAAALCGTHDYTSFCSNRRMKKSAVRTVESIDVQRDGDEVRLVFTGDGFLYHMVRIIAGTLIQIGAGQKEPEEMEKIILAKDRHAAGPTAPACGLYLWAVEYPNDVIPEDF